MEGTPFSRGLRPWLLTTAPLGRSETTNAKSLAALPFGGQYSVSPNAYTHIEHLKSTNHGLLKLRTGRGDAVADCLMRSQYMTKRFLPRLFIPLAVLLAVSLPAVSQVPRKNPPPLTEADVLKMTPAQVKEITKNVKVPEDDPSPDEGNKGVKGTPATGAISHRGMDFGPCLECTVDLPDPKKKKGDEAGANVILRAMVIKLAHDLTVCYDLDTMALAAVWKGGFLDLSKSSYENSKGSMAPQVPWPQWFTNLNRPGWAGPEAKADDPRPDRLGPLPADWMHYRGHYLYGNSVILRYYVQDREVLEMPEAVKRGDAVVLTRTFQIAPASTPLSLLLPSKANKGPDFFLNSSGDIKAELKPGDTTLTVPAKDKALVFALGCSLEPTAAGPATVENPTRLVRGGPQRNGPPLVTKGVLGKDDGKFPYVVDALTIPFENPAKSWMRTAAVDFFSDGRMAVSTLAGDVWIVDGIDKDLQNLQWTRFATGLYEPLGVKIVDDQLFVLGRDRITRLVDINGDGEADWYESFFADGNVAPSFHAFSFDLQTDKEGNFYFLKSGRRVETYRPGHGALIEVSPDGQSSHVVATGFRHPNGMGIGPNDEIVVSDNQGEWTPSSKVSLIKPGGFYGYVRKGDPAPKTYDAPLFWLPMSVDNSSGGQCWVTSDKWGPLSGSMLHTSYGTCSLMYVMTQKSGDRYAAATVAPMPLSFRSGIMRARVNPVDGQVYVVGPRGWATRAHDVGCVERVRYTGAKTAIVTGVEFHLGTIRLRFSEPLASDSARDLKNYQLDQWNYLWSHIYGSPHMSPSQPTKVGQDALQCSGATLSADGTTVELMTPDVQPVHQLRIQLDLRTADGKAVKQTVYATIHAVPGS
jgi:hypothetical protein